MPSRRFTVAAVASALALCCVLTLHINDESIKSEVAVEQEHAGMMFDHDDDEDEDSDELSPAEQALVDAANGHTVAATPPPMAQQPAPKKAPPQAPKATPKLHESAQDALSPSEKALI